MEIRIWRGLFAAVLFASRKHSICIENNNLRLSQASHFLTGVARMRLGNVVDGPSMKLRLSAQCHTDIPMPLMMMIWMLSRWISLQRCSQRLQSHPRRLMSRCIASPVFCHINILCLNCLLLLKTLLPSCIASVLSLPTTVSEKLVHPLVI